MSPHKQLVVGMCCQTGVFLFLNVLITAPLNAIGPVEVHQTPLWVLAFPKEVLVHS